MSSRRSFLQRLAAAAGLGAVFPSLLRPEAPPLPGHFFGMSNAPVTELGPIVVGDFTENYRLNAVPPTSPLREGYELGWSAEDLYPETDRAP